MRNGYLLRMTGMFPTRYMHATLPYFKRHGAETPTPLTLLVCPTLHLWRKRRMCEMGLCSLERHTARRKGDQCSRKGKCLLRCGPGAVYQVRLWSNGKYLEVEAAQSRSHGMAAADRTQIPSYPAK